ncbi:Hsp20 family protein [Serratia ureilytica]|uniref:Hsp20 family protein n=1 Tax=Serratia ureilytica TaxID=300181 RepID=UPI0034C6A42D
MAYRPLSLIPGITSSLFSDRFDRMDNLFSRLTGEQPLADSPAYNLLQQDETHYTLTVSVPGYHDNELDISVQNNQLTISGKRDESAHQDVQKGHWLHQGIRQNDFTLGFTLHNRVKVQSASLDKGLLTLKLEYEIPEEEKPQRISISNQSDDENRVIEHKG